MVWPFTVRVRALADAAMEMRVATKIVGDDCVLKLTGDFNLTCSDQIGDLGVETLESDRTHLLVLDLSAVTFIDSTGLGALVRMYNAAAARGKGFSLRNPSGRVWRALRLTALDTALPIETSG